MCGRYTIAHSSEEICERFEAIIAQSAGVGTFSDEGDGPPAGKAGTGNNFSANFNVAPSNVVPIIFRPRLESGEPGSRVLDCARWGFSPFWAREASGRPLINARAESLMSSKVFKHPFMRHRCIVPADGFYEWQKAQGKKIPMHILLKSHALFGMAGILIEGQTTKGDTVRHCVIITVPANDLVKSIHDRMPAILAPHMEELWLDSSRFEVIALNEALAPYPEELMEMYPVSQLVNSVRHNSPECIKPLEDLSGSLNGEKACPTQLKIPFN